MDFTKTIGSDQKVVPFVDLYAQYVSIKEEIDGAIRKVIKQSAFVRGPYVDAFEAAFAAKIGVDACVSCANGTDALYIAMRALGVQPGDEVIVPAHSWISTSETVTQAGGQVVFCDTDATTFTLNPEQLIQKVTKRTVGIIPVHLYGQSAEMSPIMDVASRHDLWVIEDCAQAHLATYHGRKVGTFGTAATFSFYPGKNLGAMGDAGAIVTSDAALAEKMRMYARHGGLRKGDHQVEGVNSRMDGLQAAILSVKLRHLEDWNHRRQMIAARYTEQLTAEFGVETPRAARGRGHVWHLYVIQHERRDALATFLDNAGIRTVINYPTALPFLPAYRRLGHVSGDFPVAHRHQSRILSLPIFPEMTEEQQERVVTALKRFSVLHR